MALNNSPADNKRPIKKISTGISGLDEVLQGGFPQNRTTLIKGAAGTGKTVLGLEFLYRSALQGEPVIFISFEERADALRENALAAGWDLQALEEKGSFFLWEAKIDHSTETSGEFSIESLLAAIKGKAEQMSCKRILIDAVDVFLRIFQDPVKEKQELYKLHDWLTEQKFTAILTTKKILNQSENTFYYEILDYMADCVILLDLRVIHQVSTRRLRIIKYRGSGFYSNEYPYIITHQGNVIMPITEMKLTHKPLKKKISSGNPDLDILLGGGYYRGSSILISGPTGSGKTTLAATFSHSTCSQGNRMFFISFEESEEAIIEAMVSPGIDLSHLKEKGNLQFHTILPEALVAEEHLWRILQKIEQFNPHHIVVDAISACQRMSTEAAAFDFLVRLINICKQHKLTCLMINQLQSNEYQADISGIGISSIVDTLIRLQYIENNKKQVLRDLLILKSRGIHHSNQHYLYSITDNGIQIDRSGKEKGVD